MKKVIYFATIAALMSGCASPKTIWSKPDSTQQEYNSDAYDCTQQSRVSWSGGGTGGLGLAASISAEARANNQAEDLFKMCMRARGYTDRIAREGE